MVSRDEIRAPQQRRTQDQSIPERDLLMTRSHTASLGSEKGPTQADSST